MNIELRSFAKINLSLDVVGLRADGYHEVKTVMQKTSLYDVINISYEEGNSDSLEILITSNKPYVPTDERNLAYKAALLINEKANKKGQVKIDLAKRVPVSAGLAGGSGNAAAVLIGLNKLWGLGLKTEELLDLGKKLGADVPFLVLVQNTDIKMALGEGTGEILTPIEKHIKKDLVIAKPNFGVSTKEVYQGIDRVEIKAHPDTDLLLKGIREENMDLVYKNMVNVLENYTLKEYPEVNRLKEIVKKTGKPEMVMMSGSGPSVMGFYPTKDEAKDACMKLRSLGYEAYWLNTK